MADIFKKMMHKRVGVGGIHCSCCNCYFGKDRNELNQLARQSFKKETEKEIEEGKLLWEKQ